MIVSGTAQCADWSYSRPLCVETCFWSRAYLATFTRFGKERKDETSGLISITIRLQQSQLETRREIGISQLLTWSVNAPHKDRSLDLTRHHGCCFWEKKNQSWLFLALMCRSKINSRESQAYTKWFRFCTKVLWSLLKHCSKEVHCSQGICLRKVVIHMYPLKYLF